MCKKKKRVLIFLFFAIVAVLQAEAAKYIVVDTGQNTCYDNEGRISFPKPGRAFYGQDAQYESNAPSHRDNGNGTVSDLY